MGEDTASRQTPEPKEWTVQDLLDRFQTATDYFKPLAEFLRVKIEKLGLTKIEPDTPGLGKSEFTIKMENGIPSIELKFTEPSVDKDRMVQIFYLCGGGGSVPAEFRHTFGKKVKEEFVKTGERAMVIAEEGSDLNCSLAEMDESLQMLKRYSDGIPEHAVWPEEIPQGRPQN